MKDAELRSLVGDSYRDVLASADAIGSIAAQCQKVRETLEGVVRLVSAQEKGDAGEAADGVPSSVSSGASLKDDYFELASDVKAILDSQEAIYSYIDNAQFLSAAVRYQEAVALYKKTAPVVKSKGVFPFLAHAWPGIKALDIEIYEKAKGRVVGGEIAGAAAVADALAACGVLRPVEGVDLLGYYLEGRKKAILERMGESSLGGTMDASVSGQGIELLAGMWETVGVAMAVFGEGQDLCGLDVFGDGDRGPAQDVYGIGREADVVRDGSSLLIHLINSRQVSDHAHESSMRVSNSLLHLENEAWLKQMAEEVRRDVFVPLLEGVSGCRELREHVQQIEEAERGGRTFGELTWVELSRVATGQVISLWNMMGREAVLARGKAILRGRFDVAVDVGAGLDHDAFRAFDASLGEALAESIECVRIDGPVFEDVVASAFGGLMERTMGLLEEAVNRGAGDVTSSGFSASSGSSLRAVMGVVQFISMLQTRSEAYRRLLRVQYLGAREDEPKESTSVLLPWARETSKRVGAVREGATRAWATACAAAILGNVKEDEDAGLDSLQVGTSRPSMQHGTAQVASTTDPDDSVEPLSTPMYPSEWLTRALTQFCGALEDTVSSQEDLTCLSMETFKGALVGTLQALYAEKGARVSKARALQRIYDTTFVTMLSWGKKGDADDVTTKQMLRELVTAMDPVEWEEHRTSIEVNARRYTHHVASYLRTSTELTAIGKTDGTTAGDAGNMQLANASNIRFAYLPAKLPSRAPRPSSAYVGGLGLGSGTGDVPVVAAAADDAFSIAGLQGLAKAKAAEVSDFFSFL